MSQRYMDISISCQKGPLPFFFYFYIGCFNKSDYPCLCLCLGLEQITIIRPRLRISRHFSQILRTEALIFIFGIPHFNSESIFWNKIGFLKFFISNHLLTKRMLKLIKTPNLSNPYCEVDKLYVLWLNHNDLLQF